MLDHTHEPELKSWVASANGHPDFPIQNLPLAIFRPGNDAPRAGVAIGGHILDLPAAASLNLFAGEALMMARTAAGDTLNVLLALGAGPRRALRLRLVELLKEGAREQDKVERCLHDMANCTLEMPASVGDYTDFYAGINHATAVGKLFRPDNPLLPNYKHVPIGYHGRASSIAASGRPVRRPNGQFKPANADAPRFGPSQRLDYELELGVWVGPGNELEQPVRIANAADHIAGYCLLNDWSARDLQAWEYQPLGPFLAKSFATTVSPWIVTPEALAPFRCAQPPRPAGDPRPLPYLMDDVDQGHGALDLELEVLILTAQMRRDGSAPQRIALSNARHMYWTVAQMLAHHTSNGCNLRPGDLLGTGTISGPDLASCGSLLEASQGNTKPIVLTSGESRTFLQDGDEVIMRAYGRRSGYVQIGFGECRAAISPAHEV